LIGKKTDVVNIGRLSYEYPDLIEHVLERGDTVASRLGETKEILDLRLELLLPEYCMVGRKGMNDDFAYEEITQLLAGRYDEDRLRAVTPRAADLITAPTAYGPRVWPQLETAVAELESNRDSRRAVVYIGRHDDLAALNSEDESVARAGEMPCTCLLQFHLRGEDSGLLHMSVYMRSWDLVWGLSYDVPSFVAVQMAVANHLGAEMGMYVHTAGSGHIYDRHYNLETWPEKEDGRLILPFPLGATIQQTRANAIARMEES